jgi:asparagine synthase (glutamine-hydrolysing)
VLVRVEAGGGARKGRALRRGGDELFAGYKRQRNAARMDRWRTLIRLIGPAASLIGKIPLNSSRKWNYIRQQIPRVRDSTARTSGFQHFISGTEITTPRLQERIFCAEFRRCQDPSLEAFEAEYFDDVNWEQGSMLEQYMIGDLRVHMPAALLPRLDRTSMAHSLEARVPFLSHRFVDWSLTVPVDMKSKGLGKYVLREAARPWLPEGILELPKQGFQMPVADWFLGDFSDFAMEAWRESGIAEQGYLDPVVVEDIFEEHRSGRADHGKLLYAITMFSCWWNARPSSSTQLR